MTLSNTSRIDVKPFVFSNADLLVLDEGNTAVAGVIAAGGGAGVDDIGKYHWATAADVAWDWDEIVWSNRLFKCLTSAPALSAISVIPAFQWGQNTYKASVGTHFPNVMALPVAPFQGMTDFILRGKSNCGIISLTTVEVGVSKGPTWQLTIGSYVRSWPEKVRELLASVYYYSTLQYLNGLRLSPQSVKWTGFGIFVAKGCGCLVVRMTLDDTGCHVNLVHEGGVLTLGPAIEYVVGHL